jgi:DNA primase catalytic core
MPIPEAKIRQAKEEADLLALSIRYGLSLTQKGEDYFTRCPWHKDDTPSLSLTPSKGLFHCFGCGAKGNAIQFVQKMEGISFPAAFDKVISTNSPGHVIAPKIKNRLSEEEIAAMNDRHHADRLQTILESAFMHMESLYRQTPEAKRYMAQTRGLPYLTSLPDASPLRLGYCSASFGSRFDPKDKAFLIELSLMKEDGKPHFENCVIFPLRDAAGILQGLYGRRITGTAAAAGTHYFMRGERKGVFSVHDWTFARGGGSDFVYLTESAIDALSLHQLGIPSVLALHGVNGFTPCHEEWLKAKKIRTVYLLLDGDRPGREASVKLAAKLTGLGYTCHIIELPDGQDPNSFFSLAASDAAPHTLKDLEALPGYPRPAASPSLRLKKDGDTYTLTTPRRNYAITGLTAFGFDRLRVTVKASTPQNPARFHIDSLDLYVAKARSAFVDGLCNEVGGKADEVHQEMKAMIPLLEEARLMMKETPSEKTAPEMTEAAKAAALAALKDPALIKNLLKGFEDLGMIGEEKAKLIGYLGTVSRLLDLPLGMLVVSRSGAGKTALQDAICSLVPEESLIKYTRLTGQALFYKEQDGLKYKVLAIEEEDGMAQALYSIRTLASSQRLTVATTRSDPKTGKLKTDEYTVEGPVFIMIATTNPDSLDAETRSRFIILTIDESREQTQKIMEARKTAYTLEGRLKGREKKTFLAQFHNMQRLLKPIEVVNNFAPFLDYPFDRLQMRREFGKYMTLINTITLLHQYQRPQKTMMQNGEAVPYIEVMEEDIALANELVLEFFPNSIDELAPHTRRLASEIGKLVKSKEGEARFTRKELRDTCGWNDYSIRQGLEQLCTLGYVGKVGGQNGVAFTYELLIDAGSEDRSSLFLTSVQELKRRLSVAQEAAKKEKGTK